MVATKDEEVFGILDLVREQEANGLEGLLATIDVVAKEEVVGLGREAAILEKSEQIVVLAVNISANLVRVHVSKCSACAMRWAEDLLLSAPQARAEWAVR